MNCPHGFSRVNDSVPLGDLQQDGVAALLERLERFLHVRQLILGDQSRDYGGGVQSVVSVVASGGGRARLFRSVPRGDVRDVRERVHLVPQV